MSREAAGAALRALRESRDWSLADLAAATGVSVMGLSFLERGARKPHKGTVQKVENGLGLPPGTYARLVVARDPDTELAQLVAGQPLPETRRDLGAVVVERHTDTAHASGGSCRIQGSERYRYAAGTPAAYRHQSCSAIGRRDRRGLTA